MIASLTVQFLNGLAGASTLFLIAVGLSLIFGVSRIVNFAHGSMYMIGLYIAVAFARWSVDTMNLSPWIGFWGGVLVAVVLVGLLGALIEILVLRRVYIAPELFQLLATFAVVLILRDAMLYFFGAEDLLGPKAPAMKGAIDIMGKRFPEYDVFMIFVGPLVLVALWLFMKKTRFGLLIRAATQDREMVGALGVNQRWLFTGVFVLGSALAALGGALQMPREPANMGLDLTAIGDAFVVVVVGGMGSIPGAYLAALIIAVTKSFCYGAGTVEFGSFSFSFSKFTLVVEFLIMAFVLVWRPWGLLGKLQGAVRSAADIEVPIKPMGKQAMIAVAAVLCLLIGLPLAGERFEYSVILAIDVLIAILFAASLHFIMGPGGMHSFGHAAYFGLGAYGAALLLKQGNVSMEVALLMAPFAALAGAAVFGWFAVKLSGVYLAMLTLAFAQIVWSVVFQWDEVTGGSNGLVGVWPSEFFKSKSAYFYLTLALVLASVYLLRRLLFSPFGYAMRAGRDSALRAEATGIHVLKIHWVAFMIAGLFCGLAGALYAFAKGTISPETISVGRSVDGLIMVLLGGVQTVAGPVVGSAVFTWLHDVIIRSTDYWRAVLGSVILVLIMLFPQGIVGGVLKLVERIRPMKSSEPVSVETNQRGNV
jgi:branched-chain amino acid transport system permease protein